MDVLFGCGRNVRYVKRTTELKIGDRERERAPEMRGIETTGGVSEMKEKQFSVIDSKRIYIPT